MRRLAPLLVLVAMGCAATSAPPTAPKYEVVRTVPIGAPDDWDFLHFDPEQNRLYVSHSSEITVLDGTSGAVIGRVTGIAGAHDVATVPALGRGYADNGDTGEVTVFDLTTFRPIAKITADRDSDAMIYDPSTHLLVVANGDPQDASIIDVAAGKRLANVALGGTPESMVLGGKGEVYVNVDSINTIAKLNLRKRTIEARWATPGCESPHGLAIDPAAQRLFASCRNGKMIIIDVASGKPLALVPIGLGTDSAAFDPERKLAFSANKDGTLSVVAEGGPSGPVALGEVKTAPGAKNMALNPKTGRIFLVTADVAAHHPPKRAGGPPDYDFTPGSAKLMILDPQ